MASMPANKIEKSGAANSAANSNVEWQAWGEKDPLFGVIPLTGRERDGATPWSDADFYETGRADWDEFQQRWEHYGLTKEACLEIGCGAGRITRDLARGFVHVYCIDVAEGMISLALPTIPSLGVFLGYDVVTFA